MGGRTRLAYLTQWPEAGRFWIRYTPAEWPVRPGPWVDLGRALLGRERGARGTVMPSPPEEPLADLLYLPPVPAAAEAARRACARGHLEQGTPVLFQLLPGDDPAPEGSLAVFDPLPCLLLGVRSGPLPRGVGAAVWPLIPGVSDGEEGWRSWLATFREAGVEVVHPQALELTPEDRRWLAGRTDEGAFARLFHGPVPGEREACRRIHQAGLRPLLARPEVEGPERVRERRRLAEKLLLAGELWDRLGRPPGVAHELMAAGRWVDGTDYDLPGLAREGNLRHLPALAGASLQVAQDHLGGKRTGLAEELLTEYLEGGV